MSTFHRTIVALVMLLAFQTFPARALEHPNIMVFLVDDMGVMDTSVAFLTDEEGNAQRYPLNDYYRTPAMESLAEKGIRFNQFYAMSVCSPTRISIMTGQNAARHHATNWINPWMNNRGEHGPDAWNWKGLRSQDVTLPALLRKRGYTTIHVGKAHFGPEGSEGSEPLNLGFDVNIGGASFGAPGSYYAEKNYGKGTNRDRSAVPHLDDYHGSETFLTEALTIEAKKAVDTAIDDERPFYLYFSHYAVHAPFESDPRFAKNYENSGKPKNAQAFATLIEGMDKSLGDMMAHFRDRGVAKNTLIIFLGDNGTDAPLGHQHQVACAAPLRGKKGAHYEGGMRVPFIAAWAQTDDSNPYQSRLPIPRGAIQTQVANVTDIFPTLMNLLEIEPPETHMVDGLELKTLLSGASDARRPEQFLMNYPHGRHRSNYFTVWRDGPWKLIFHALPQEPTSGNHIQFEGGNFELFNLEEDPFEQSNLATTRPDVLNRMISGLTQEMARMNGQYPVDDAGAPLRPRTN